MEMSLQETHRHMTEENTDQIQTPELWSQILCGLSTASVIFLLLYDQTGQMA